MLDFLHAVMTLPIYNSPHRAQEKEMLPKRTEDTHLSDDELLLFDMLFDCSASATRMSHSVFAIHMNCAYNHSLEDAELLDTIDSLLSRGLIQRVGNSANSPESIYSLTGSGGELWEPERCPDWQRYVTTIQKGGGSFPMGSIVAMCADELVGRQCLGAMFASGLITPVGSIRTRTLCNKRIVPWKMMSTVFALRCKTSDNIYQLPRTVDYEVYESTRCWWRSVNELLSLRERPKNN